MPCMRRIAITLSFQVMRTMGTPYKALLDLGINLLSSISVHRERVSGQGPGKRQPYLGMTFKPSNRL